ncbi:MAG: hypothetical protein WCJ40_15660, partial [Planctomycetota bacterium]
MKLFRSRIHYRLAAKAANATQSASELSKITPKKKPRQTARANLISACFARACFIIRARWALVLPFR